MKRFNSIKKSRKKSKDIDEKIEYLNKECQKTGLQEVMMTTSNIYVGTEEIPNTTYTDVESISIGGYGIGLSGADGNSLGGASLGINHLNQTGVALSPPHPVTGARRSAYHITTGLGDMTALRPGQIIYRGFGNNPPPYTMGGALWFFDPTYNSGEGHWYNLEWGNFPNKTGWGFWDTIETGQFAGISIFNTDLSQHPSGGGLGAEISNKISGINFGDNGQIGTPTTTIFIKNDLGDPGFLPIDIGGLSKQGYDYLLDKSGYSDDDDTGASQIPFTITNPLVNDPRTSGTEPVQGDFSGIGNGDRGKMPDDFRDLPPQDLYNLFSNPNSTEAQEAAIDIVSKEVDENKPETASKLEQIGKAGETFLRYVTGTLPETLDNSFLGQEYVNSLIASAEPFYGDGGPGDKLVFGDNILGTTQPPKRSGNKIVVDYNYDFKNNAEELKGKKDQLTLLQNTFGEIVSNAFGTYSIDGSPKLFGGIPVVGSALDLITGGVFSKFIELGKLFGGSQHRPGELTMDLSQIASENPQFLSHLLFKGIISGDEYSKLTKGEGIPEPDPRSEETFEYNKPSWFTFSHRTPDGRIFGYNYSGAFGELKPAESRGERGSTESGYGTKGYDIKTNSGGTIWTMDYSASSKPKNKNNKKTLGESANLTHFDIEVLNVDVEQLRKGIMPEFPKDPPPEMINGYSTKSRLAPKTIEGEPFIKITKKDLAKNHRLKDSEIKRFMEQINAINEFIKQNPDELKYVMIRYPKDDPRLAQLNWEMDQKMRASEEYMETHFPENEALFKKIQNKIKDNIEKTDPRRIDTSVPIVSQEEAIVAKKRRLSVLERYKKQVNVKPFFERKTPEIDWKINYLDNELKKTGLQEVMMTTTDMYTIVKTVPASPAVHGDVPDPDPANGITSNNWTQPLGNDQNGNPASAPPTSFPRIWNNAGYSDPTDGLMNKNNLNGDGTNIPIYELPSWQDPSEVPAGAVGGVQIEVGGMDPGIVGGYLDANGFTTTTGDNIRLGAPNFKTHPDLFKPVKYWRNFSIFNPFIDSYWPNNSLGRTPQYSGIVKGVEGGSGSSRPMALFTAYVYTGGGRNQYQISPNTHEYPIVLKTDNLGDPLFLPIDISRTGLSPQGFYRLRDEAELAMFGFGRKPPKPIYYGGEVGEFRRQLQKDLDLMQKLDPVQGGPGGVIKLSHVPEGDLLSEGVKLGHFEPEALTVDIEKLRKGIVPDFPKDPPPEMINGYSSKSRLAPKTIEGEPFIKITKKDLARNHTLTDKEINDFMNDINLVNNYIKKNPAQLKYAMIRYPKDDPRLAQLNFKMDQMKAASEQYMNTHFPENQKLFSKLQDKIIRNINQTDPKNFTGHKDAPKFVETDITDEERRRKTIIRHFKKKK